MPGSHLANMPAFFLGVDGGGTSCRVRLCDKQGKTLGEAVTGPANITRGLQESYRTILSATKTLLDQNNLDRSLLQQTRAGLGLAGIVQQADIDQVCSAAHPFHSVCADSDAVTACIGAHGGEDGGVIILGTGSQALAFHKGEKISIGGWGFMISDHGSGAQLGLKSIRFALLAHQCKRLKTPFTQAIMSRFNFSSLQAFHWSKDASPAEYGEFAKIASEYAAENDKAAIRLIEESAQDAGLLIQALIDRGIKRLVLHGGMVALLSPHIDKGFKKYLCQPQQDALSGAIIMAMKSYC